MIRRVKELAILGGGPAGLAVGYHARKMEIPFIIYEQNRQWGGNCVTHQWEGFRYDSGAHRIHGINTEVIKDFFELMNGDLARVSLPSHIYKENGRFVFPLEMKNIVRNMPVCDLMRGLKDMLFAAFKKDGKIQNFEDLAVRRYGLFFAKEFLLDYTEKLWGDSCTRLDTSLAGTRLAGLHLKDLLKNLFRGNGASSHMEGDFYYPEGGVGRLMDALAKSCGLERIRLESKVTRIFHDGKRIRTIELNNANQVEVDEVVSTLPLNRFLGMVTPRLVQETLQDDFHFRNLIIVALFLDKPKVTDVASLYFPGADMPFTRVYEPRNRCSSMSPEGKTSLVAEIPCSETDPVWKESDEELVERVTHSFCRLGWIKKSDILGCSVKKMLNAYPVLRVGYEESFRKVTLALKQISNLTLTGRNGRFLYSWIHDQYRWGKEVIKGLNP